MTKKVMMFLLVGVESSADLIQQSTSGVSTFHASFMKENEMAFEKQQNLGLDEPHGGDEVPPSGCNKLGCASTETGLLGFPLKCEYWWNADHSSMPFHDKKTKWLLKTKSGPQGQRRR